jgi:hypothetical protein
LVDVAEYLEAEARSSLRSTVYRRAFRG